MTISEKIERAIADGKRLNIIYNGGSHPGAMREIAPISITNGKVMARCYTSNEVKTFTLEKIEIIESEISENKMKWSRTLKYGPRLESIEDLFDREHGTLIKLGWHVEHDENNLTLHRMGKRGKLLKSEDIRLSYIEYSHDIVMNLDGEWIEERKKRTRPYSLRSPKKNSRTFGNLVSASIFFMEWAIEMAPNPMT